MEPTSTSTMTVIMPSPIQLFFAGAAFAGGIIAVTAVTAAMGEILGHHRDAVVNKLAVLAGRPVAQDDRSKVYLCIDEATMQAQAQAAADAVRQALTGFTPAEHEVSSHQPPSVEEADATIAKAVAASPEAIAALVAEHPAH